MLVRSGFDVGGGAKHDRHSRRRTAISECLWQWSQAFRLFSGSSGDNGAVAVEVRTDVTGQTQSIGTPNIGAVPN